MIFDKTIESFYKMLLEMPERLDFDKIDTFLDNSSNNRDLTLNLIKKEKIFTFLKLKNIEISLYKKTIKNDDIYYLVYNPSDKYAQIVGYVRGTVDNYEYNETEVWQKHPLYHGIIREFYLNYLINVYEAIVSDKYHANMGENFWIKLAKESLNNNIGIFMRNILDNKEYKINNIESIKKTFGNNEIYQNFRIIIRK
jgi:hypothetical protein